MVCGDRHPRRSPSTSPISSLLAAGRSEFPASAEPLAPASLDEHAPERPPAFEVGRSSTCPRPEGPRAIGAIRAAVAGRTPVAEELVLRPEVSPLRQALPQGSRSTSAPTTSARSKSTTTTTPSRRRFTRADDRDAGRGRCGATASCCRIDGEPTVGPHVGGTPLIRADRLAEALGRRASSGSRTTRSTSRRSRSRTASSPSRCRRPSSSASRPSAAPRPATWPTASPPTPPRPGWRPTSSIPADLEQGEDPRHQRSTAPRSSRVNGTYDQVNRLCTQIAFKYGWGFVNVNLRPFYAEGSKTMGFEIAEDLGWRTPAARRRARWPAAA